MYVLCMMLCIILNNIIIGVEPRWKEKRKKDKGASILMHPVYPFLTFEIDAAG